MHIDHLSSRPIVPVDRFGQPIAPGDLVVYIPPAPLTYRVTDVRPSMDRNATPGSVVITLQADANLPLISGQPCPVLLRVGYMDGSRKPVIGSPVRNPAHDGSNGQPPPAPEGDPATPEPGPDQAVPGPGPRLVDPAQ